jgi:hypothetical protein|tara:strand:+ start:370 stop:582 length:213 start_codon:yes stop_codon:yes gene_type:complete
MTYFTENEADLITYCMEQSVYEIAEEEMSLYKSIITKLHLLTDTTRRSDYYPTEWDYAEILKCKDVSNTN